VDASWSVFRMHPDGTGNERVSGHDQNYGAAGPSLSPDGTRMALGNGFGTGVWIRDLATGATVRVLDPAGHSPRWSPTGEWIAYVAREGVTLAHPDGTGARVVSVPGRQYIEGLEWSPDGRFLLARDHDRKLLDLIEISTATTLPLPFSKGMSARAWKP
jgi:Tol biopolymer transport system component